MQQELSREIKSLEKSIHDGSIIPTIEKYVISYIQREQEKETETRFKVT